MKKEGESPGIKELEYLHQLTDTLDESAKKLEDFYKKKDYENFDKMKKFMLKIFDKISEMTRK